MKLRYLVDAAVVAGFKVARTGNVIEITKGRVRKGHRLGIAIYLDGSRFWMAHRIDLDLDCASRVNTVVECASILGVR